MRALIVQQETCVLKVQKGSRQIALYLLAPMLDVDIHGRAILVVCHVDL